MDSFTTPAVVLVGLLSGLVRQHTLRRSPPSVQEEFWSGWLTWAALYLAYQVVMFQRRSSTAAERTDVMRTLRERVWPIRWSVLGFSVAAVTAQIVRSRGILPFASPIVTLAALLVSTIFPAKKDAPQLPEVETEKTEQDTQAWRAPGTTLSALRMPVWIPANVVLILLLAASVSYQGVQISAQAANTLLFLVSETAVFALLPRMSRVASSPSASSSASLDWDLLGKTSLFSFAVFSCLLASSMGITSEAATLSPVVFLRATSEAGWWISIFTLSSDILSTTAVTLEPVATSFDVAMTSGPELGILLASFSAVGSLWQSVSSIPQSRRFRNWLYLLILIPMLGIGHKTYTESGGLGQLKSHGGVHPVAAIVQQAQQDFSAMLSRQSKTLEEATKEYSRRYGRKPPPNFDRWFELALENDFALVDEFDRVTQALEPYWGVPPLVIRSLTHETLLQHFPRDLAKFEIRGHQIVTETGHYFTGSVATLLDPSWAELLPDMTLVVNAWDEPNVVIPRDMLDMLIKQARSPGSDDHLTKEAAAANFPRFLDLGGQNSFDAMVLSCPADSPARNPVCHTGVGEDELPFVRNRTQSMDVCEHCEFQRQSGVLMTPNTMRLTHSLVPVWSQSRPSSFNDVIFPSPFYLGAVGDYKEDDDPDWADKKSQLYWTGSATGGHAKESNWKQGQRQRLALMAQAGSTASVRLLRETKRGGWVPYTSDISQISSLLAVRMTSTSAQCEPAACEAERAAFGLDENAVIDTRAATWQHKFVLDMDGNAYSGRYYTLLRSRSTVFKQAVFQEAHDDRLMPWIHYVPVSTGFEELPELVRFMGTTIEGDEIASQIATEGRNWAFRALRPIDLQLVFLRMLLEFGRIVDPERDAYS